MPSDATTGERQSQFLGLRFWRAYLVTMRPYLLFVSGAAAGVGLAFIPEPVAWRVALGFLPLFLSYGFGQALTDCFQTDTDAISSPYRPLVQGIVTKAQVMSVSLVGLSCGVVIMAVLNPIALVFAVLAVLGLLTYTPLKRRWWGGPAWNSWIVALLPIMGRLMDSRFRVPDFLHTQAPGAVALLLGIGSVFFGYSNFVIAGYFKDISADRQTGYRTFPVVFGWQANAVLSDIVSLLSAALAGASIGMGGRLNPVGIGVFLAGVAVNVSAQVRLHRTRSEALSHGPIEDVVRAFIFYCLGMALNMRPAWWPFALVFYVLFELVLRLRPERTQV